MQAGSIPAAIRDNLLDCYNDEPSDSNHGITLNEAKFNYLRFGACEEGMLRYVRPPQNDEKSALR